MILEILGVFRLNFPKEQQQRHGLQVRNIKYSLQETSKGGVSLKEGGVIKMGGTLQSSTALSPWFAAQCAEIVKISTTVRPR